MSGCVSMGPLPCPVTQQPTLALGLAYHAAHYYCSLSNPHPPLADDKKAARAPGRLMPPRDPPNDQIRASRFQSHPSGTLNLPEHVLRLRPLICPQTAYHIAQRTYRCTANICASAS